MKKIENKSGAVEILKKSGETFAVIPNPEYVFPAYEICPLAEPVTWPLESLSAVLMDMDGTTTTTEELCIHSLEYMIRRISGKMQKEEWAGLDHVRDYPNIIGNSTTKHVEYLIDKYWSLIIPETAVYEFVRAALWTLVFGKDKQRCEEVKNNVLHLGCGAILHDNRFLRIRAQNSYEIEEEEAIVNYLHTLVEDKPREISRDNIVRIAIDVYYHRYHQILEQIKAGNGGRVSEEVFGSPDHHLIEPMPGVEVFLPLVKGLLGDDIKLMLDLLVSAYEKKSGAQFGIYDKDKLSDELIKISRHFELKPVRTAIVTSSIFYEADIVVTEVFKLLCAKYDSMALPINRKKILLDKFRSYQHYYDGFVTASDSSEIRLKPHRDLYSIALHRVGVPRNDFSRVAGFEDSESGTIAIRAAGIGLCAALPFAQTSGHNFEAASHICKGGLPEIILKNKVFLNI